MELEEITLLTVGLKWKLAVKLNPTKDKLSCKGITCNTYVMFVRR